MGAWHDEEKQLALVYSVQERNRVDVGRRIGVLARIRSALVDFTLERGRYEGSSGARMSWADRPMASSARGGWLLVTGGPGLGKSAILNDWLRRCERAGRLTAVCFIRAESEWNQPEVIRANLAAQIEWRFPELHDDEDTPANRLERLLTRLSPVLKQRDERLVVVGMVP